MDFLKKNMPSMPKTEVKPENSSRIREVENSWMKVKKSMNDAIYELGKAYFEANKDNTASEFAAQIETINNKAKEEYIWHQYRLSLEGQRMCDKCNSSITADSAFCNRCGAPVTPIDFSPILNTTNNMQSANNFSQGICCPKCGKRLVEGAMFCETCGTRIV